MDAAVWNAVWPEWKFKNVIGRGAYGIVYRAVRLLDGKEEEAAIKVVSLPQDDMEIDQLRAEGFTEEETQNYYASMANEFYEEIQTMKRLNGNVSIVNVQDSAILPRADEFGWNVLIRMECLTPLYEYLDGRKLTEAEVAAMGIDLCRALEVCEENHILHRDVKPENIFVDAEGHFKLGDFGIARQLESTTGAFTRVGTPFYSAPEVAEGKRYDRRVDIYSLGLVLYRIMNSGRLPFMPEKRLLTPGDRRTALERRLSGETLPAPSDASAALSGVILKACEPKAKDRYSSAAEFREALEGIRHRSRAIIPWWRRRGIRIAGILLAVLLAGGGTVIACRGSGNAVDRMTDGIIRAAAGIFSGGSRGNTPAVAPPVSSSEPSGEEPVSSSDDNMIPVPTDEAETSSSETESSEEGSVTSSEEGSSESAEPAAAASSDTEAESSTEAETSSEAAIGTEPAETVHTHSYGEWTVTAEPSCSSAGERSRSCSCGESQTEPLAALGHSFGGWTAAAAASCTAPGKEKRICSRCGAAEERPLAALGHSFGSWTTVTAASCTAPGKEKRTCSRCGTAEERTAAALGHSFGNWTTVTEASCTAPGKEKRTCSRCGTAEERTVAALGHDMVNGICTRCGESTFQFVINADNASYTLAGYDSSMDFSKKIIIPDTYKGLPVTRIRDGLFQSVNFSGGLQLPAKLNYIGEKTFADAVISGTLVIPGSVKTIAEWAFVRATLNEVILSEGVTTLKSVCFGSLQGHPSLTVPSTVKGNEESPFALPGAYACVTHFNTLTINSQSFLDVNGGVAGCLIDTIRIGPNVSGYSVKGNCLIQNATGTLFKVGTSFTIPTDGSVKIIDQAPFFTDFNGVGMLTLYTVTLPEGVKRVVDGAYSSCIQTVYLPHSLEYIFPHAFRGGWGGNYIYAGTTEEWIALTDNNEVSRWGEFSHLEVGCTDGVLYYNSDHWEKK